MWPEAIDSGDIVGVTNWLEDEHCDVNVRSRDGMTPLISAVQHNHDNRFEIVKSLLAREDVNVNLTDDQGFSALNRATQLACVSIVQLLLTREELCVNHKDADGFTALHRAAHLHNAPIVELLLTKPNLNVNVCDDESMTALNLVCRARFFGVTQVRIVHALLGRADILINNPGGLHFNTPLINAISSAAPDVIQLLLARDEIELNEINYFGCTALMVAAGCGYLIGVQMLLEMDNIDLYIRNMRGKTARELTLNAEIKARITQSPAIDRLNNWSVQSALVNYSMPNELLRCIAAFL